MDAYPSRSALSPGRCWSRGTEMSAVSVASSTRFLVWYGQPLPDGRAISSISVGASTPASASTTCGAGWQAAIHPDDRPALLLQSLVSSGELEARLRRSMASIAGACSTSARSPTTPARRSGGAASPRTSRTGSAVRRLPRPADATTNRSSRLARDRRAVRGRRQNRILQQADAGIPRRDSRTGPDEGFGLQLPSG